MYHLLSPHESMKLNLKKIYTYFSNFIWQVLIYTKLLRININFKIITFLIAFWFVCTCGAFKQRHYLSQQTVCVCLFLIHLNTSWRRGSSGFWLDDSMLRKTGDAILSVFYDGERYLFSLQKWQNSKCQRIKSDVYGGFNDMLAF